MRSTFRLSRSLRSENKVANVFMGIGLPAALALQPQKMNLNVADLEEQFQGVDPKTGLPRTVVFANKGL